jgi:hypothetical protein
VVGEIQAEQREHRRMLDRLIVLVEDLAGRAG